MPTELTFLNLRENLKLLLGMQNVPYIHDSQREFNAINKFVMAEFTPDYVIELIGKLIYIKRHAKLGKDQFWQGCAVNISDAYAYRIKIETVYPTIAPPTVGVENFQPAITTKPATQSKDAINRVSTIAPITDQFIIDSWQRFRNWCKTTLTRTSCEIIDSIAISVDGQSITINAKLSEFLKQIILKFFNEEVKPSIIIIFTGETNEQEHT